MNTKDQGSLGVLVVMQQAVQKGYIVCVPYGDNQRYDLLFDRNGQYQRVQVKYITPKDGRIKLKLFTVMHDKNRTTERKYRRVKYTAKDIDFFAIVNANTHEVYMIPLSEINGHSEMVLRTDEDLRKSSKARLAKNYLM